MFYVGKCLCITSSAVASHAHILQIGPLRARSDTLKELQSQFTDAQRIGGQKKVLDARTRTGVKDTYQAFFVEKLCSLTTRRGRTREDRAADVQAYLEKIPRVDEFAASPVWRIRGTSCIL